MLEITGQCFNVLGFLSCATCGGHGDCDHEAWCEIVTYTGESRSTSGVQWESPVI